MPLPQAVTREFQSYHLEQVTVLFWAFPARRTPALRPRSQGTESPRIRQTGLPFGEDLYSLRDLSTHPGLSTDRSIMPVVPYPAYLCPGSDQTLSRALPVLTLEIYSVNLGE